MNAGKKEENYSSKLSIILSTFKANLTFLDSPTSVVSEQPACFLHLTRRYTDVYLPFLHIFFYFEIPLINKETGSYLKKRKLLIKIRGLNVKYLVLATKSSCLF